MTLNFVILAKGRGSLVNCHVLGINHAHQMRYRPLGVKLKSLAKADTVILIAEEVDMNEPNHKLRTIARNVANTGRIPWLPFGMTSGRENIYGIADELDEAFKRSQKKNINAFAKHANDVKENFWLDCIEAKCRREGFTDGTVLIICGYNHREFVAEKARSRGFVVGKVEWFPADLPNEVGPLVLLP